LARNFDRNRFAHRRSLRLTLNLDFRTDQLRDLFPEALDREACVLLSNDFTGCSFAGMRIKAEGELGLIGGLRGRKLSVGDPRFGDVSTDRTVLKNDFLNFTNDAIRLLQIRSVCTSNGNDRSIRLNIRKELSAVIESAVANERANQKREHRKCRKITMPHRPQKGAPVHPQHKA